MKKSITALLLLASTAATGLPMEGFPPKAEDQVTRSNWASPPHNRWGFKNVGILPSLMVPRAGDILQIPYADPVAVDELSFDYQGKSVSVAEALKNDFTDGFLVIRNGEIIFEKYYDGFDQHDHHLWASCTKSLVSLAAGILVDQGLLDLQQQVTHYLPELKGSAFDGVSIQQVMDMETALDYSENYADLRPGTVHFEYFRRIGLVPAYDLMALDPNKDDTPRGVRQFLNRFKRQQGVDPGTVYEYQSPNVDVIGWIIARQSGLPLNQFISRHIWQKMQPEHDAVFGTDAAFTPIATGGFTSTLRDFARLGLAILNNGKVAGDQVFPEQWVRDIHRAPAQRKATTLRSVYKQEGGTSYDPQLVAYHNFWWIHDIEKGIFTARGVFGQVLYINRDKNIVIATYASAPTASNARRETSKVRMAAIQAVADSL